LDIGGWYDTMVGIQPGSMTLAEFFAKLGITEKDVRKALAANESINKAFIEPNTKTGERK